MKETMKTKLSFKSMFLLGAEQVNKSELKETHTPKKERKLNLSVVSIIVKENVDGLVVDEKKLARLAMLVCVIPKLVTIANSVREMIGRPVFADCIKAFNRSPVFAQFQPSRIKMKER